MASYLPVFLLSAFTLIIQGYSLLVPQTHYSSSEASLPLPLVIWHGLGDTYNADGILSVGELAERIHPGTFVYNIRINDDPSSDRRATFFGNLTEQLTKVCADIGSHPILSTAPAIDALGFSQGGQFLRGYIERCNAPPVRSLVTFGSQHNGISDFQTCGPTDWLCKAAIGLLRSNSWSHYVQARVVPAQYYRDAEDMPSYLEYSNYLADINNERANKSDSYKKNLQSLENFIMYMFTEDTTVIPKETSWFAEVNSTTGDVTPLKDRAIYQEDWLGLKLLDQNGALKFLTVDGAHMELDDKVLGEAFSKYFGPQRKDKTENSGDQVQMEL
ncbi:alpha/beta-hydrolase [Xylona heveae TC161]|uniref:Palmitoyl-protein thioesterase 1 n=1 Tax=Xylona heveae (strain CBS 132557 / TC161) TaxID=1328760 RepID=A0A165HE13_XYLHT|nr:alpha/beta-hydrolase [Xylona heveae TC161]KZF23368.1 alpha/beta-hydrolase [Xylona heveae TC161]